MSTFFNSSNRSCNQVPQLQQPGVFYRTVQAFYTWLALSSLILIIVVLRKYRSRLIMHSNLKVLFFAILISAVLQALAYAFMQLHSMHAYYFVVYDHYAISQMTSHVIARFFFIFFGILKRYLHISIIIERTIATIRLTRYEKQSGHLGRLLLVLSVGVSIPLSYLFHSNFHIFGGAATIEFTFIAVDVVVNLFCLPFTVTLYIINKKALKRSLFALSPRFQLLENLSTTSLLCWALAIHIIFEIIFECCILYLRIYPVPSPRLSEYILAAHVTPFAWFFLPIIIIIHVKVQERNRRRRIRGLVSIKASGCEGSRIYSTMLSEQWRIGPANERIGPNHHGSAVDVMQ